MNNLCITFYIYYANNNNFLNTVKAQLKLVAGRKVCPTYVLGFANQNELMRNAKECIQDYARNGLK